MANKNSFLDNAVSYFDKIMEQKYISKAEILALKKILHNLAEDDESYKKLYNRITTISNAKHIKGKNEANVLQEFYKEFQAEITKHKKTASLPEKVWTTQDYKEIPHGSCIYVESATETTYTGTWSSMEGSSEVTIGKRLCSETSDLQELLFKMKEINKKDQ